MEKSSLETITWTINKEITSLHYTVIFIPVGTVMTKVFVDGCRKEVHSVTLGSSQMSDQSMTPTILLPNLDASFESRHA